MDWIEDDVVMIVKNCADRINRLAIIEE